MPRTENLFPTIANEYQSGRMDNDLDTVFAIAAANGIVLLPGDGRPYANAKSGSYDVDDMLLPFDKKAWKSVQNAHDNGMDIYPDWFTYKDGFFEYSQENFLTAFIHYWRITKHHGNYMIDGTPVPRPQIKNALRRSLAIVRADAGRLLYGAMAALDTMCVDDAQEEEKRGRLTREALSAAMNELGYAIRYNQITCSYEITGKTPAGRTMNQDDLCTLLYDALADQYKGITFDLLAQYTAFDGREHSYNPVLDLLRTTEWDQKDRMPQLYSIMHIENDTLSKQLVNRWLLQTVALLFNDPEHPYGAEGCLVLNGQRQGEGKTSLLRHLALREEWFAEGCSIDDHDKDTTRRIVTRWIAELGELESTLKSDISKLKAFVTAAEDHYRLPYAKTDIVSPRHTSLAATCNSDRYLIDPTGNRRWWSLPVTEKINREEMLQLDPLQLWAQIYYHVSQMTPKERAACYRLTDEERAALDHRNGNFEKPIKGQDEVADIIDRAAREGFKKQRITVTEFKEWWPELRPYTAQQLGAALKACGIETTHGKSGRTAELPIPQK